MMLNFHFEIKSDKKFNGGRNSAARHEKYILREDEYRSDTQIKNKEQKYRDCLTGKNPVINLPNKERLIYESPFGNIKQDENGIYISQGASVETVAIALSVAEKIYGREISVRGSDLFREKNIKAASELNLPIKFLHRSLEKKCRTEKERIENDRREFENRGGRYVNPRIRIGIRGNRNKTIQESGAKFRSFGDLARGRLCLPKLSEWNLDRNSKRRRVLLSSDQIRHIRNKQRALSDRVRWDNASARKRIVEQTVANILTNINHTDEIASSHIQYIARDSIYSHKGGCLFVSSHLPKWANDDPKKFWEAADLYERKNGEHYKEIVFSLPNVLSLNAQKKIIEKFIDKHLKNFYYTYAIHNKIGAISGEEEHPHVHIMFSTREIDNYERKIGRTPEKFFLRSNSKNPEKGGCKKSAKWNDNERNQYLYRLRYDLAKIENEILEENGIHLRVDPRSLQEQKQNALRNGDELLAKVLDRDPEKYVRDFATITDEKNPVVANHRKNRQRVKENIKKLEDEFIKSVAEDRKKLSELWKEIEKKRETLNEVYDELPEDLQKKFEKFVGGMNESASEVTALRSVVFDTSNSFQKAVMDFLEPDAKKSFENLKKCVNEKRQWEYFEKTFNVPEGEKEVLSGIKKEIETNISILNFQIKKYAKECRPFFDALAKDKKMGGLIRAQGINYINKGGIARTDLRKATIKAVHDVNAANRALRLYLKIEAHKNPKTLNDVRNRIVEEGINTNVRIKQIRKEMKELEKQIITPARAIFIARDVFTKSGFKKIRAEKRKLEKQKHSLSANDYNVTLAEISKREKALEEKCRLPASDTKIKEIAAGILRKNAPVQNAYNEKKELLDYLVHERSKWREVYNEINVKVREAYKGISAKGRETSDIFMVGNLRDNTYVTPKVETNILASAIAKISGNEKWGSIVMRKKPDENDEWQYLSETEKADLRANQSFDRY
ncbi:MAG: MobA/MobL family protein [Selenomonadaceae bacterium]|nr:MobA/MobL family protein [Selenomonadaceae bacterium]